MITFKKTFLALTLLASVAPCVAEEAQPKQEIKITDLYPIKSDWRDQALCYAETLTVLGVGTVCLDYVLKKHQFIEGDSYLEKISDFLQAIWYA
jgi:hypothetical protein